MSALMEQPCFLTADICPSGPVRPVQSHLPAVPCGLEYACEQQVSSCSHLCLTSSTVMASGLGNDCRSCGGLSSMSLTTLMNCTLAS